MKRVYPILLKPIKESGYAVTVPDLEIYTQGYELAEAVEMVRDAIGMWACYELDQGRQIPEASDINNIKKEPDESIALIDIDIDAYRRAQDNRAVKKNLTLPSWLNEIAEREGINFSQVLQEALKERLGIKNNKYSTAKTT